MPSRHPSLQRICAFIVAALFGLTSMVQAQAAYRYQVSYPGLRGPGTTNGPGQGELDPGSNPDDPASNGGSLGSTGSTGSGSPGGTGTAGSSSGSSGGSGGAGTGSGSGSASGPGSGTGSGGDANGGDSNSQSPLPVASLQLSSASLLFGTVESSRTATRTVTLSNQGAVAASLSTSTVGGGFIVSHNCGSALAAGASCLLTVSFSSSVEGAHVASFSISASGGNTAYLSLQAAVPVGESSEPKPMLQFSTSVMAFGSQTRGASAVLAATLTNTGTVAAALAGIGISAGTQSFAQSNNCGTTLAAGASCIVNVAFTPAVLGPHESSVFVAVANGANAQVALSGYGIGAALTVNAASLAFGTVAADGTTYSKSLTLTNSGNAALSGIATAATEPQLSTDASSCGAGLSAGASCNITVWFKPTSASAFSGTLNIASANGGSAVVSVVATGAKPSLSTSVAAMAFGDAPVHQSAARQTITLSNNGNAAAALSSIAVSAGDFSVSDDCNGTLAAGATCTLTVGFTASSGGARLGTLTVIASNASALPVALSGNGLVPTMELSPAALTFDAVNVGRVSDAKSVTVSNTSTTDVTVAGISVVAGQQHFAQSNNCGTTLLPGASCTVNVWVSPTITGSLSGVLVVDGNAGLKTVTLTGAGTEPAGAFEGDTTPGDVDAQGWPHYNIKFLSTKVGSSSAVRNVTFRNSGTGALAIAGISLVNGAGDFGTSNNCGVTLAPGASCVIALLFTPSSTETRTGSVVVASDGGTFVLDLSGTGIQGNASLSLASLSFPSQQVATASTAHLVTLTNSGTAPLSVGNISINSGATDFSQTNNCTAPLVASSSCTIAVTFAPAAAGSRTGSVSFTTDGTGASGFALAGTGQDASATLTIPSFPETQVEATTFVTALLKNTGIGPLQLTLPQPSAVTGTDFGFESTTCTAALSAGESCAIAVKFAPTAVTSRAGALRVTTAAGEKAVSFSATGLPLPMSISEVVATPAQPIAGLPFTLTLSGTNVGRATTVKLGPQTASSVLVTGSNLTAQFTAAPAAGSYGVTAQGTNTQTATWVGPLTVQVYQALTITDTTNAALPSLAFGTVSSATTKTFRIANSSSSSSTMSVTNISLNGDPFSVTGVAVTAGNAGATCTSATNMSIPVGKSCDVTVTLQSVQGDYSEGYALSIAASPVNIVSPSSLVLSSGTVTLPVSGVVDNNALYMRMDGANNGTSFVDTKGATAAASNGAITSTAQSVAGGSSAYFPNTNSQIALTGNYVMTGDFTVDLYLRVPDKTGIRRLIGQSNWQVHQNAAGMYFYDGSNWFGGTIPAANTWFRFTASRQGSTIRVYIDGTQVASSTKSGSIGVNGSLTIGRVPGNVEGSAGTFIDEVRIIRGQGL